LKARFCVEGNRLTYDFCAKHNVPFRHCGKLVVAADSREVEELAALNKRGEENGVEGLRLIDAAEIRKREPHIRGTAALVVPSTGIVSAEELVHAYARVAGNQGANMVTRAEVVSLTPSGQTVRVGLRIGDEEDAQDETIEARCVINAAGLYADEVAAMLGIALGRFIRCAGVLRSAGAAFVADQQSCVSAAAQRWVESRRALYEDVVGDISAGADGDVRRGERQLREEPVADCGFRAQCENAAAGNRGERPATWYSGLRPKLVPPEHKGIVDFVITRDPEVPQAIHLVGMESPGLTAAPAVAEYVAKLVKDVLA